MAVNTAALREKFTIATLTPTIFRALNNFIAVNLVCSLFVSFYCVSLHILSSGVIKID